jgi:uncharacterized protein YecT (DUF1311 family)
MRLKLIFLATIYLFSYVGTHAQTDATGETELYQELEKVDYELNLVCKQTLKKLSPYNRRSLVSSQRKWMKHRDITCKNNSEGGVYENKIRLDCLIQTTRTRTTELANWNIKKKI